MKKQILNLGKALNKAEQRNVFGGYVDNEGGSCTSCTKNSDCGSGVCVNYSGSDCGTVTCGCGKYCL